VFSCSLDGMLPRSANEKRAFRSPSKEVNICMHKPSDRDENVSYTPSYDLLAAPATIGVILLSLVTFLHVLDLETSH
jgi:hypothetical protein